MPRKATDHNSMEKRPILPRSGNSLMPCRFVLTAFLFSGLLLAYALRFSLSVALVAMVNQTASAHEQGPLFATTPALGRSPGNDTAPEAANVTYPMPPPQLSGAAGDGQCPVLVQHRDAPRVSA